MRVRVRATVSGSRNGEDWPEIGEVIDLPSDEAATYLAAGIVESVKTGEVETADEDTKPRRRSSGLTKGNSGL